jgi:hypothetical protein
MVRKNTSFFFTLLIQHFFKDLLLWIFSITFMVYLPRQIYIIHFDSILYFIYISMFIFQRGEKVIKNNTK